MGLALEQWDGGGPSEYEAGPFPIRWRYLQSHGVEWTKKGMEWTKEPYGYRRTLHGLGRVIRTTRHVLLQESRHIKARRGHITAINCHHESSPWVVLGCPQVHVRVSAPIY